MNKRIMIKLTENMTDKNTKIKLKTKLNNNINNKRKKIMTIYLNQ